MKAIGAGGVHTCALTEGGGVKCWGLNEYGQLGDGSRTNRLTPVDVVGLSNGVAAISAGYQHTCALTVSGAVQCWGLGAIVGDGTATDRLTPVDVIGLTSGVTTVAAGGWHTCALTGSGAVLCWGGGGRIGDGTTINRLKPVDVVGLSSGMTAIAAGGDHTCALTVGGAIKCWGRNDYGQLGTGTITERLTPVDVVSLSSGVAAIAAGVWHTCALTASGGAKCWGRNNYGQLGNGTTESKNTPVDVIGLSSGVAAIAAGRDHTCALNAKGGARCWGSNEYGQLGGSPVIGQLTPVNVIGLSSEVTEIAAGSYHTCALTDNGGVQCWGGNSLGQLGDGTTTDRYSPVDVVGLSNGVAAVSTGYRHTCALTASGAVQCWGSNEYGQLGNGTTANQSAPVDVTGLSSGVTAIAAGATLTCALTSGGGVQCWGNNQYGQLGDGTTSDHFTPAGVAGLSSGVQAITAGSAYTCALTESGAVQCWGANNSGHLGDGTRTNRATPVDVAGFSSQVTAISAGYQHTCALTVSGAVQCWGLNDWGQLGNGMTTNRLTPVDVVGFGEAPTP